MDFSISHPVIFDSGSHRIFSCRLRLDTSYRTTWRAQNEFQRIWIVSSASLSTSYDTIQSTYRMRWLPYCLWSCLRKCIGQQLMLQIPRLTRCITLHLHLIPSHPCRRHPISWWKMISDHSYGPLWSTAQALLAPPLLWMSGTLNSWLAAICNPGNPSLGHEVLALQVFQWEFVVLLSELGKWFALSLVSQSFSDSYFQSSFHLLPFGLTSRRPCLNSQIWFRSSQFWHKMFLISSILAKYLLLSLIFGDYLMNYSLSLPFEYIPFSILEYRSSCRSLYSQFWCPFWFELVYFYLKSLAVPALRPSLLQAALSHSWSLPPNVRSWPSSLSCWPSSPSWSLTTHSVPLLFWTLPWCWVCDHSSWRIVFLDVRFFDHLQILRQAIHFENFVNFRFWVLESGV